MNMKTRKEIKLKDGSTLPKGLLVTFQTDKPWLCLVQGDRPEPYRVRVTSAFKCPGQSTLESWISDCGCESVAGNWVEPDGFDSEGSPSWLLALGLI